jgi:nitrite reductase/ring-hydroxylating ferredoxin subunit
MAGMLTPAPETIVFCVSQGGLRLSSEKKFLLLTGLCRLADLPDGVAVGLAGGFIAIRLADCVMIYVNACPHLGVPLDWLPGRFMSADGRHIVCATHGAAFRPADGVCLRGPCRGERLTPVPCEVRDGEVRVKQRDRENPGH